MVSLYITSRILEAKNVTLYVVAEIVEIGSSVLVYQEETTELAEKELLEIIRWDKNSPHSASKGGLFFRIFFWNVETCLIKTITGTNDHPC